ncbi:hypothetical protein A3E49_01880 [Candidatus Saccharibacteria bacterium RIFCSPHIGHO2_12_FULL_49_19]|nr:MAG: hypothetical protein A2708_00100 [Candidatus Saccharibacteria bacterium RIFCSPHIGHO2_01_FULL_49_21]OGL36482.1 MAG: hypothetical protein A3E49_01880 [Candidatus Saccharibacteria bacterium RIFCSPHIGHO2_12_FULL_49_19]OGL38225.1 MAG: hypothetical protein A3B63_01980 [Candidatus Saccharibacteria bacterium RIFCSPLOWO2_01_FULL_49_22]
MAKESSEQKLIERWWVRGVVALALAGIAYGFASLAIDSGALWQYGLAIGFLVWAFAQAKRSAKALYTRVR